MRPPDPRNGQRYRDTIADMLAHDDLCWLCGHPGARTADHVIPVKDWYERHGTYEGVNHPTNLRPAHGAGSNTNPNPCPTCHRHCNQDRATGRLPPRPEPRSRKW